MRVGQHLELYCRKVYECAMGLQAEVLQVASKTKALDTLLGQTLAVRICGLLVCCCAGVLAALLEAGLPLPLPVLHSLPA
jgi:hypothetical protein